jgi:hypothetical protein
MGRSNTISECVASEENEVAERTVTNSIKTSFFTCYDNVGNMALLLPSLRG